MILNLTYSQKLYIVCSSNIITLIACEYKLSALHIVHVCCIMYKYGWRHEFILT